MPKGRHKGKPRVFSNPQQLEEERKREEREREWRHQRGEETDEEEDEEGKESGSESSSEEDGKKPKAKGPNALVETSNPNHVQVKTKKLSELKLDDKQPLSRREREAADKERARLHYQKLHAEGKTVEAQSDLARLAVIRKQREDAAKKREEERKAKEAAKVASKAKPK